MGTLLVIAARNLRRHLRRTLIASSAIAFGLMLLVFSTTLQDGMFREMIKSGISMMAGHVVVQGAGYQEHRDLDYAVEDSGQIADQLRREFKTNVVRRVFLQGLLTSPHGSMGVAVTAVEPDEEIKVSDFHEKIVEGEFVKERTDIVIGATLAETLDVKIGDKLVFMLQVGPELESRLFRVKGIYRTGAVELDGFFAMIPLEAAQELLGGRDLATQIAVQLDPDVNFEAERDRARALLAKRPGLEVLTWKEAMPEVHEYMVSDRAGNYVMLFIIGIIAAFGILNTMLMSVLERVREFGVLLSIGMTPTRLAALVLIEGVLLGTFASLLGFGLGVAISYPMVSSGVDMGALMGGAENMSVAGLPVELMVYGFYPWSKLALFTGISVLLTVAATLYPVWFASRLNPINAMEHV